jgi:putative transposase
MCRVLHVSRSGYYSWLKRSNSGVDSETEIDVFLFKIKNAFEAGREKYGYRRVYSQLINDGVSCSISRVRRFMRANNIHPMIKKRFKNTTDSNHALSVAPNLLNQKFYVDKPNVCWVSDITYIWTVSGWLYLAVFIDLFSRGIVGWSMDTSISRKLIIDAFRSGVKCRKPDTGLIVHSDRGSQYASEEFKTALLEVGSIQSMSRKGNCWDNAVSESFFASLKKETVYGKIYKNQQKAKMDVFEYIEVFYNKKRLHSTLGNMSPRDYENKYLDLQKAA